MNESAQFISLRGARQHNLKGIDLDIAVGKLTVICGVSGSGKTSLALNTLYAEGQRRYIESFSAYTRQFLQRIDKPQFDSLTNLPPSIAVVRETRSRNNRSTVGTASEMLETLRVVFSNSATLQCFQCRRRIVSHTPKTALESLPQAEDCRAIVCFEITWRTKTALSERLFDLQTSGFIRLIVNGKTVHLADDDRQAVAKKLDESGRAFVVVDRLKLGRELAQDRTVQSLATAFEMLDEAGNSCAIVLVQKEFDSALQGQDQRQNHQQEEMTVDNDPYTVHRFSSGLRCEHCGIDYPESEPRLFNFNSPVGACEMCEGFGEVVSIDMAKVIPDDSLSLNEGAVAVWRTPAYAHELEELRGLSKEYGIPFDVPISSIKPKHWQIIREGVPERNFGGLNGFFAWLERKKYKMHIRAFLARWRTYSTCSKCNGQRLNSGSLAYRWHGQSFAQLCEMTVDELSDLLTRKVNSPASEEPGLCEPKEHNSSIPLLAAEQRSRYLASEPQRQLLARTEYLQSVGLGYLCLSRPLHTLSGGESQRVMMTTLLGSSLVDMLYVFDEPTVGLHPQDTERIAKAILGLRDRGNTVILVEHEPYLMRIADEVIEIGPQAGERGGSVTFQGTPTELASSKCLTGEYLNGKKSAGRVARSVGDKWIGIRGALGRNLQVEELQIPLGSLTVMIGPSGSGKSTLVLDTLVPALCRALLDEVECGLPFEGLFGSELISGCLAIDQSPIQRSTRSSPVTYSKAMDEIRQVFSDTIDAKARNFGIGHFSFNSELGRCPTCEGMGFTSIDMQFMADVELPCQDCDGKRFQKEVLEVRYRDLNIFEVLELSVERAQAFFRGNSKVQDKLAPLVEIGLGYLPLGQRLSTLSAGESMRLKLASHLEINARGIEAATTKGKLIVLDEPTTGLHFSDVEKLLRCIDVLIDSGNSVLVIEHNQQMISAADHLIELGPGAGPKGGRIIATGTVESVRTDPHSVSGRYI